MRDRLQLPSRPTAQCHRVTDAALAMETTRGNDDPSSELRQGPADLALSAASRSAQAKPKASVPCLA